MVYMEIADERESITNNENDFSKLYFIRDLLKNIELSGDNDIEAYITCVEVWNGNLYVGTSLAEILHFVQLPGEATDALAAPNFILASRHQITSSQQTSQHRQGVQQIVLLPNVTKACILANGSLSFYTLPELSPALTSTKPINCSWVGGVEQASHYAGQDVTGDGSTDDAVIMICAKNRIRLVSIAGEPKKIRDIEYGGCIATSRQDDLACVADAHAYALLDLEHQQKIPLFPICSLDDEAAKAGGAPENIASIDDRGHSRSSSLQTIAATFKRRSESPGFATGQPVHDIMDPPLIDELRVRTSDNIGGQSVASNDETKQISNSNRTSAEVKAATPLLQPHIAIAGPTEFLVTVGTNEIDPGVGMFVNHDGDIVRSTLEFGSYPNGVVVDREKVTSSVSASTQSYENSLEDGFVLAVTRRLDKTSSRAVLEVHPLDQVVTDHAEKVVIDLSVANTGEGAAKAKFSHGIRSIREQEITVPEIFQKLQTRRLDLSSYLPGLTNDVDKDYESKRVRDEVAFLSNLCSVNVRTVLWSGRDVYWALRTPMLLQFDYQLSRATLAMYKEGVSGDMSVLSGIQHVINSIRGQTPQSEIEFLGLTYIQQKAALLLFQDLMNKTKMGIEASDEEMKCAEEALMECQIDPRVVLMMVPQYYKEVVQNPEGIWVFHGVIELIKSYLRDQTKLTEPVEASLYFYPNILNLLKSFLMLWRNKKGFGSIADEKGVFDTVDATLLHILLELDKQNQRGPAKAGSVRAELNAVVDHGVDCFDRAVTLLEQYRRLYVLSRLYQHRKLSYKVLSTWKRIMDGEEDAGGELTDGEHEMRKYLTRIKDVNTVRDYGIWLAQRNPALGVQVFADDSSRVRFEPVDVVALLKKRAPNAVKDYLEYLVFNRKHDRYINDLLVYYLDAVLHELENSKESRAVILKTYENYRALRPPKPTYQQFVTENSDGSVWWESRLRLLQILGAGNNKEPLYDVAAITARVQPFEQEMVPEMIILGGRQNMHEEALKLLTHNLGDFDTAIRYCLLGGTSLFYADGASFPQDEFPSKEEQSRLLKQLLREFLKIEDLPNRLERTEELLERFGGWFDASEVLDQIPDSWSLNLVSEFLVSALRRLTKERCEAAITKALSGCQSLKITATVIEELELLKPKIETAG